MPFLKLEKSSTSLLGLGCVILGCFAASLPSSALAQEPPQDQAAYKALQQRLFEEMKATPGLLTAEIAASFNGIKQPFRNILSEGPSRLTAEEKDTLKKGLEFRILTLSDEGVQNDPVLLNAAFQNVKRDLNNAGARQLNATDKRRFRIAVYEIAKPFVEQLLQNNWIARSNAIELLLEMETVPPQFGGTRVEVYDGVAPILERVLADPKQADVVKVRAASGVKRFYLKKAGSPLMENTLASAMAKELNRKFISMPYENALLMALENLNAPRQLVPPNQPVALKVAVEIISDKNRHLRTRCRAARVVGRAASDNVINFDAIAWKVAELSLETAFRYTQANDKQSRDWLYCGWYLYTAFHPQTKNESRGMLTRRPKSEVVKNAYDVCVPVLGRIMAGKSLPAKDVGAINTWVGGNKPQNLKYDPGLPAIQ